MEGVRAFTPLFARELTTGERAQRQQFLDSYVRINGCEPSADEIQTFERRLLTHKSHGG